jgi:hypothetical protein
MIRYKVRATRDGQFWFVEVPEIDRVTQGRNAAEVGLMARELIFLMTGHPLGEIDIEIEWELPEPVGEHLRLAKAAREAAATAEGLAEREERAAAHQLRDAGISVHDIGAILGLSSWRARQRSSR